MATQETGPRRWQSSLYARAALFLALGAAAFVGAVAVLSRTMVDDSVDRLLTERLDLARMVGAFVENRLLGNLNRLATLAGEKLDAPADHDGVRAALETEFPVGIYAEGAFALDRDGTMLTAVPADLGAALSGLPMQDLAHDVDSKGGVVSSDVLRIGRGDRPVVVLLQAIRRRGRHLGYIGGVMPVTLNDALAPALRAHGATDTVVDLVDQKGVVVASTDPRRLLVTGDHEDVLAQAISEGRGLRGRCHGCHLESEDRAPARVETVLAFAPLPTVPLGISVQQPEADALAPAFALQRRLVVIGGAFVALFLLFAGLSVRSVVDPVKRLTRAVRTVEEADSARALPKFGRDEVGELATTLDRWRSGMRDSLGKAEEHRAALRAEMERTRRLLQALQQIAGLYMAGADAEGIIEHGLDTMLRLLGYKRGAVRVILGDDELVVRRLLSGDRARRLVDAAAHRAGVADADQDDVTCTTHEGHDIDADLGVLVSAHHVVPRGICIDVVLAEQESGPAGEPRWLGSLVHHMGVSVTTRLLHDQELARQQQQEQYLHRVMRAQEDERRRVARELHDTVAQDLAALRLEVERLGARADSAPLRAELAALERRASEVLESVRRTLFDLRLTVLENLGFLPTIQWHLERMEKQNGIRGMLAVRGDEREPPYDTAVALFRIFQESLQNVIAHAKAEHVSVTVTLGEDAGEMVIEDDGVGFDLDGVRGPAAETGHGLGLLGMEERARLVAGHVRVESAIGEGTTVTVNVPLPPKEDA